MEEQGLLDTLLLCFRHPALCRDSVGAGVGIGVGVSVSGVRGIGAGVGAVSIAAVFILAACRPLLHDLLTTRGQHDLKGRVPVPLQRERVQHCHHVVRCQRLAHVLRILPLREKLVQRKLRVRQTQVHRLLQGQPFVRVPVHNTANKVEAPGLQGGQRVRAVACQVHALCAGVLSLDGRHRLGRHLHVPVLKVLLQLQTADKLAPLCLGLEAAQGEPAREAVSAQQRVRQADLLRGGFDALVQHLVLEVAVDDDLRPAQRVGDALRHEGLEAFLLRLATGPQLDGLLLACLAFLLCEGGPLGLACLACRLLPVLHALLVLLLLLLPVCADALPPAHARQTLLLLLRELALRRHQPLVLDFGGGGGGGGGRCGCVFGGRNR
eukprot:Rhum_TRINITY_DN19428_c0_g1::Rhum_TRINITY_DN19428_c0_g1_i1::g.170030::m.170030